MNLVVISNYDYWISSWLSANLHIVVHQLLLKIAQRELGITENGRPSQLTRFRHLNGKILQRQIMRSNQMLVWCYGARHLFFEFDFPGFQLVYGPLERFTFSPLFGLFFPLVAQQL